MKRMSKKNQCYLCGGKLLKGYCPACGLDNTKLERTHYHLNESNAARRLEAEIEIGGEDRKEKKENKAKDKTKNKTKNKTENRTVRTKRTPKNGKSGSGYSGQRVKLIRVVLAVIVISGFAVDFIKEQINQSEFVSYEGDFSYEGEDPYTDDPYRDAAYPLSDDGEVYETELEPGEYLVGVHLPEGKYLVELMDGEGSFGVTDYENNIYLWENFGQDQEYEVTGMTDVRLYTGARVEIDDDVKLKFATENGQTERMESISNPLSKEYTLTNAAPMTAGIDFEAGIYDVQLISEQGWTVLNYNVPTDAEYAEGGVYERGLCLDASGRDRVYRNLVLPKGTVISIEEEEELLLTPSEKISTMDYSKYYDIY